jgi:DNA-binding HxlR family transcriptional regulator
VATLLEAGGPNAMAVTTGIIGDEWTLWVLGRALGGVTHYSQWLRAGPISTSVLTSRLGRLVAAEVMERVRYRARPPRDSYQLTARGRQLWPVLLSMWAWEQVWVTEPATPLPLMRHAGCGAALTPVLVCQACDQEVTAREVTGRFGPSGGWQRSVPSAATRRRSPSGTRPAELVDQTMAMIGNRWSTALLGAAFMGATRFAEFEARMGAPPTIVAERLRTFCDIGVLCATPNPSRPDWVMYHLTDKGRAFYPVIASTFEWGQRWFRSPEGPALLLRHTRCRHPFHPRFVCAECRERLRGHAVQIVRGGTSGPSATTPALG